MYIITKSPYFFYLVLLYYLNTFKSIYIGKYIKKVTKKLIFSDFRNYII